MDETDYRTWWALHLRVARGEPLSTEEQAAYEAGLSQLHREENLEGDIARLRAVREQVAALEVEQAKLRARHEALEAEIGGLEAALSARTRQLLGVGI